MGPVQRYHTGPLFAGTFWLRPSSCQLSPLVIQVYSHLTVFLLHCTLKTPRLRWLLEVIHTKGATWWTFFPAVMVDRLPERQTLLRYLMCSEDKLVWFWQRFKCFSGNAGRWQQRTSELGQGKVFRELGSFGIQDTAGRTTNSPWSRSRLALTETERESSTFGVLGGFSAAGLGQESVSWWTISGS